MKYGNYPRVSKVSVSPTNSIEKCSFVLDSLRYASNYQEQM